MGTTERFRELLSTHLHRRLPRVPASVRGQATLHLLRWASLCHGAAALRPHTGGDHKGRDHAARAPARLPCGAPLRLGLPRRARGRHHRREAQVIRGRADVLAMGIAAYNEECRAIVQQYTADWRKVVERFGRWVDFDDNYKTMDLSYMESVWWVFKQLFDKGLVYRSFHVTAYSTSLGTPLSNFEVQMNYKEVSDPSIIVKFKCVDRRDAWILAWTTTPWTLPSNLALCVHPALTYLRVRSRRDGQEWIVGRERWPWICSLLKVDEERDFEKVEELSGRELVGTLYEPPFDYFRGVVREDRCWRVVADEYVSESAGTMIVHQAPAFGEDDFRVCVQHGIIERDGVGMVDPVDSSGCFTGDVPDFAGQHVKEADRGIRASLKKRGTLLFNGNEVHNYPHCWRSDTPLIFRAVPAWFVKVAEHRERLVRNNDLTYWVPAHVKEKRFHNWLSEARDWCVSRSRYWGAPLPMWVSDDFEEVVCVGSISELEGYAGRTIGDIHRHHIDDITIPSKKGKGVLRRVDEVFDCWFESGSMPYAQQHFPFENKESFARSFPADFIAEGLDQTRGWFYSLMVLSTLLFDKPPWQNIIVNGLVLAADGKKMSKRLQNYPDPVAMCDRYGADAVRMYMCSSPVVRAEPLRFKEEGLRDVVKDVFLPWYNAYRFLVIEATRFELSGSRFAADSGRVMASPNLMDRWINASLHNLIRFVREEMIPGYRLYTVMGGLTSLLEDLTNWYVRLNRDRMRGKGGSDEALTSLCTLFEVLLNVSVLLAPVTPFLSEHMYRNLARALPVGHPMKAGSVHFVMVPEHNTHALDPAIQTAVSRMRSVVELGRGCREQRKVGLKTPLRSMTVYNQDPAFLEDIRGLQPYIEQELGVLAVVYSEESGKFELIPSLNFPLLGKRLGKGMRAVQEAVKSLSQHDLAEFQASGLITVCGVHLNSAELLLTRRILHGPEDSNLHANWDFSTVIVMDFAPDEDLRRMATSRDVANKIQKLRKDAGLQPGAAVDMWAEVVQARDDSHLRDVLDKKEDYINELVRWRLRSNSTWDPRAEILNQGVYSIEEEELRLTITRRMPLDPPGG
ncbi:unnamed protein product [Prorocentrum cordatum]|uniref:isoleucine--tRNA ligase n=1 Tax=Prorocentrum cordatum TaxID=2364126 RepID=A0ABN9SG32_9DINO|nr:unnamed protein product [Polarella glacialis]